MKAVVGLFCGAMLLLFGNRTFANELGLTRLRELGATIKIDNSTPVELSFDCTNLTDADYNLIGQLSSLKSISISGKSMQDHQLKFLAGLTNLEAFQINGTQLTDNGYQHFTAFPKLKRLSLFHPSRDVKDFTGAGLVHLKSLPNLQRLTFAGATAGDEAFKAVGELTQLEEFSQWHNWESPEAIKHLANLKLKKIKLGQRLPNWSSPRPVSLNDATLSDLAKMQALEVIDLQEARLSYAGLIKLKAIPTLKTIKLKWIDIKESDIEKLRQDLPNITIEWTPLSQEEEQSLLVKKLKI